MEPIRGKLILVHDSVTAGVSPEQVFLHIGPHPDRTPEWTRACYRI